MKPFDKAGIIFVNNLEIFGNKKTISLKTDQQKLKEAKETPEISEKKNIKKQKTVVVMKKIKKVEGLNKVATTIGP